MIRTKIIQTHDEWIQYLNPSASSLIAYLTRQNDGIPVNEVSSYVHENGRRVHVMSNGLSYSKNDQGKWCVVR